MKLECNLPVLPIRSHHWKEIEEFRDKYELTENGIFLNKDVREEDVQYIKTGGINLQLVTNPSLQQEPVFFQVKDITKEGETISIFFTLDSIYDEDRNYVLEYSPIAPEKYYGDFSCENWLKITEITEYYNKVYDKYLPELMIDKHREDNQDILTEIGYQDVVIKDDNNIRRNFQLFGQPYFKQTPISVVANKEGVVFFLFNYLAYEDGISENVFIHVDYDGNIIGAYQEHSYY